MKLFGEKIKELRKSKGITQVEIANACGIKQSSYANIENDITKTITIEIGKQIAFTLGIPFVDLFEIKQSESSIDQLIAHEEELMNENKALVGEVKKLQGFLMDSFGEVKKWREEIDKIRRDYKNAFSQTLINAMNQTERDWLISLKNRFNSEEEVRISQIAITSFYDSLMMSLLSEGVVLREEEIDKSRSPIANWAQPKGRQKPE
jgi:transcriptional regulator with XRE-family HTH domain